MRSRLKANQRMAGGACGAGPEALGCSVSHTLKAHAHLGTHAHTHTRSAARGRHADDGRDIRPARLAVVRCAVGVFEAASCMLNHRADDITARLWRAALQRNRVKQPPPSRHGAGRRLFLLQGLATAAYAPVIYVRRSCRTRGSGRMLVFPCAARGCMLLRACLCGYAVCIYVCGCVRVCVCANARACMHDASLGGAGWRVGTHV